MALIAMDDPDAEAKLQPLLVAQLAPETAYDWSWAASVIEQAVQRLRQTYASRGRLAVFETMKRCLSGGLSPDDYPALAAELGMAKGTFETNLSRFKIEFGQMVRSVIAETVEPAELEAEIKYLMAAWCAHLSGKP